MLKQVGLIPSGNQLWYQGVLSIGRKWLVYCSTISVYVFDLRDYMLQRILTGHLNSISGVVFSPFDDNQIASVSSDQTLRLWDAFSGRELKKISTARGSQTFRPTFVDWSPFDPNLIMIAGRRGDVRLYDYQNTTFDSFQAKTDKPVTICKFHPKNSQRAVCSLEIGILIVFDPTRKKKNFKAIRKYKEEKNKMGHVVDIQFDPLSKNYFLAVTSIGIVHLFDMDAPEQYFKVRTFDKAAATSAGFIEGEPGNFYVGDSRSGALKLFNVSSEVPEKIFNLRKVACMGVQPSLHDPNLFAVAFRDGVVGLFNHSDKRLVFSTEPGHTETIFGCAYSRANPNIFATSSYDSMVKLWDTRNMKCVGDLIAENEEDPNERVIVYSVSWHPRLPMLCSSLGSGRVWIWDAEEKYPTHKLHFHSGPVYRVAWNNQDHNLIASASKDKTCVVCHYGTQKLLKKYKHPAIVFGVDWNPHTRNLLATGCYDFIVRIFDISSGSDAPIRKLSGHSGQVYNVRWHPIFEDVLMSGSNDHSIRVWNTSTGKSVELIGHTNNVRALEWNSELPHVCLSGSWDGTIRIWDILAGGTCISVITDHHADVYGLAYHPQRPFIYGSTSRDTTIRFWSLEPLLQEFYVRAIVEGGLKRVTGPPLKQLDIFGAGKGTSKKKSKSGAAGSQQYQFNPKDFVFRGEVSRMLCKEIEDQKDLVVRYGRLFDFLFFPHGTQDLFRLLRSMVTGEGVDLGKSMTHYKHVGAVLESRASELELEAKDGGGIGARSTDEVVSEAADLYLRVGNLRKYCELLVSLGQWVKAISIAPGVSVEYWKNLSLLYGKHLEGEGNEECVPHYVASRNTRPALDFFIRRRQYEEANVVAMTDYKLGKLGDFIIRKPKEKVLDEETEGKKVRKAAESFFMRELSQLESMCYQRRGQTFQSASCYFRINDVEQGIRGLEKGCELLHAYATAQILEILEDCPRMMEKLCRSCLRLRQMDILVSLLSKMVNFEVKCKFVCQVQDLEGKDLETLYQKSGLQSPSFYAEEGKRLEERDPESNILEMIRMYSLGKQNEKAASIALKELKKCFSEDWDWERIEKVIEVVYCIDLRKVEDETKHLLLAFVNFVGAQKAIWRGYYPIVPFLVRNCKVLFNDADEYLIDRNYLDFFLCYSYAFLKPDDALGYCRKLEEKGDLSGTPFLNPLKQLILDLETGFYDPLTVQTGKNITFPTGSRLPVRIIQRKVKKSLFTGAEITEIPIIRLSQNKFISLSEAVMYYECNPFSPLNDGEILLF